MKMSILIDYPAFSCILEDEQDPRLVTGRVYLSVRGLLVNSRSAFQFKIRFSVRDPLLISRSAFQLEICFLVRDLVF
jgi:hypothetical protein